jgi:hypothetical protein
MERLIGGPIHSEMKFETFSTEESDRGSVKMDRSRKIYALG